VHRRCADVEVLFSDVFEGVRKLVANGVPDRARDANACRVGQRRKAHGYAAAVTKDFGARFDQVCKLVSWQRSYGAAHQIVANCRHVANIDANAERGAPFWLCADIAIDHAPLYLNGASHRLGRAGELHEQTVAGSPNDSTVMLRNLRI